MKLYPKKTSRLSFGKIALAACLGFVMVIGSASSAHADRGWDHHAAYAHRDWRHRHYAPGVVYAPPVVYSAPAYQSPGINLILPLNFR